MRFDSFPRTKLDPDVLASTSAGFEAAEMNNYFRGKTIDDITLESLASEYPHDPAACLALFTPNAFAIFLPAFMRISLEQYKDANSIPEAVVNRLLRIADGSDKDRRCALLDAYTQDQKREVAEFLEEMSARYWRHYPSDDALSAISLFWQQFLQTTGLDSADQGVKS